MDATQGQIVVNPLMMLPFGILLGAVALAPHFFADWRGRHYRKVACGLPFMAPMLLIVWGLFFRT